MWLRSHSLPNSPKTVTHVKSEIMCQTRGNTRTQFLTSNAAMHKTHVFSFERTMSAMLRTSHLAPKKATLLCKRLELTVPCYTMRKTYVFCAERRTVPCYTLRKYCVTRCEKPTFPVLKEPCQLCFESHTLPPKSNFALREIEVDSTVLHDAQNLRFLR